MSLTTAEVLVGHGNLSIDAIDMGATDGGFTIRSESEWFDAMVDHSLGVQKKKLVRRKVFGSANVAQAALAKMAVAYGLTPAALSGITLTYASQDRGVVTGAFVVPNGNPSGFDRTYTFARIVSLGNSESSYQRDGITFVPVEFEIIPSVDGADLYFTVVDATS